VIPGGGSKGLRTDAKRAPPGRRAVRTPAQKLAYQR
jgi:hypothetical protein